MRLMRPVIRFLLWLLIAVLPLQGGASAWLPCVQLSAPLAQLSAPLAQLSAPLVQKSHCAMLVPDVTLRDHEPATPTKTQHAKCTHCTACTGASGVAAASHGLLAVLLGRAVLPAELAINDHIPAALERPPQTA